MPQLYLHLATTQEELKLHIHESILLGRDAGLSTEDTLRLDLSDYGAYTLGVSRRHALLMWEDRQIMVFDLSSPNGTYLNGEKLTPHKAYPVEENDELELGGFKMWVSMQPRADDAPLGFPDTALFNHEQAVACTIDSSDTFPVKSAQKVIRRLERLADGTLA